MKLTVKNFGPIGEAKDIVISPMTLFVGPSNTGKSYLAILAYSVVKVLTNSVRNLIKVINSDEWQRIAIQLSVIIHKKPSDEEIIKNAGLLTKPAFLLWANTMSDIWKKEISYYFGEAAQNILNNSGMSVVVVSDNTKNSFDLTDPSKSNIDIDSFLSGFYDSEMISLIKGSFDDYLMGGYDWGHAMAEKFSQMFLSDINSPAHYLPANRGGVIQSYRSLVNAAMEQASMAGLVEKSSDSPMFTGGVSDFIQKLIHLPKLIKKEKINPKIPAISDKMENEIMAGNIDIELNETGYPDYRYRFNNGKADNILSLNNTSSMVSDLASVSAFIRYILDAKNLFIIEEPESHLHPQGQRDIADILVRLANAGVFVLATTHSDIVLEQISNAVHAAKFKDPKKGKKLLGRGREPLSPKNAAVYSFAKSAKNGGGTKVEKISFAYTTGFITNDHLNVSSKLYNQTAGLVNGKSNE